MLPPAPPSATANSGPASSQAPILYLKDTEDDLPVLVVLTAKDTEDDLPVFIILTAGNGAAPRPAQRHRQLRPSVASLIEGYGRRLACIRRPDY